MAEFESKGDLKRYKILEAATDIFSTKDYHEATVEEIAKKAGVGKGTIYQYFSSKQAILENLYLHQRRRYMDEVKTLLEGNCSVAEVLASLVSFHVDNVSSTRILIKSLMDNEDLESFPADEELMSNIDELTDLIWQKGIESGEIKEIDRRIFSSYLVGVMISAVVHMVAHQQTPPNLAEVKKEFVTLALHGMLK